MLDLRDSLRDPDLVVLAILACPAKRMARMANQCRLDLGIIVQSFVLAKWLSDRVKGLARSAKSRERLGRIVMVG